MRQKGDIMKYRFMDIYGNAHWSHIVPSTPWRSGESFIITRNIDDTYDYYDKPSNWTTPGYDKSIRIGKERALDMIKTNNLSKYYVILLTNTEIVTVYMTRDTTYDKQVEEQWEIDHNTYAHLGKDLNKATTVLKELLDNEATEEHLLRLDGKMLDLDEKLKEEINR